MGKNYIDSLTAAIRRSIIQTETVTVSIGSEDDMSDVLTDLHASDLCEDYDSTHITATLLDVWGTDADGREWRLHLMQDERGVSR